MKIDLDNLNQTSRNFLGEKTRSLGVTEVEVIQRALWLMYQAQDAFRIEDHEKDEDARTDHSHG
ncbi:MAG: hypothetical protein AAB589_02720 [Patescibacteria group bacterium]